MKKKIVPAKDEVNIRVVHPSKAPPARLKCLGGSDSDAWNNHLASGVVQSLATAHAPYSPDNRVLSKAATIAGMASSEITTPLEAMLIG